MHPVALELLKQMRLPTKDLRSKSWDEFAAPAAAAARFRVHGLRQRRRRSLSLLAWPADDRALGRSDPAAVEGSDTEKWVAFREAFRTLENRIKIFTSLPIASLDRVKLQTQLDAIGKAPGTCIKRLTALAAEGIGSLLLAATVVGSGIMAERLSSGNVAVALLANTGATVAVLATLIALLGPVSGAHFNPAVSLVQAMGGKLAWSDTLGYVVVQLAGCCGGVWLAHGMFGLPWLQTATHVRAGWPQGLAEAVATFGLILVVLGHRRAEDAPWMVAAWIGAAYWFTASTSFANPAITVARSLSDTFAGIRPIDVPGFIVAQLIGAGLGLCTARLLFHAWADPGPDQAVAPTTTHAEAHP